MAMTIDQKKENVLVRTQKMRKLRITERGPKSGKCRKDERSKRKRQNRM